MDQRFDLLTTVRVGHRGEEVRHGSARLNRFGVVEKLAQITPPYTAADAIENRCLFAQQRGFLTGFRLVAASAAQFTQQQSAALDDI